MPRTALTRPNGAALLVSGLAAAFAVASCNMGSGGAQEAPPLTPVTVTSPAVVDAQVWEELVGRFQATDSVEVRPQISGRLARVHFVDGQMVRRGDLLFTIDASEQAASADQARAALALAESELARAERLRALDAISEQEYDQRLRGAEQARAALRAAQVDVGFASVRSPITGRVSDRRIDPGNVVVADQTVLTTVVSLDPIHFEFSADPALAQSLPRPRPGGRDGATVEAKLEGEDGFPHRGRLDFLDNQVDPRSGVVRGRAVFENASGRFTPGQFGRIRIARGVLDDAVVVPESAIASDQTRKYVLVVGENDMVEQRPVTLGPQVAAGRVVEGVDSAARVIVDAGGGRVFPGMPVQARAQAQGNPAPASSGG